MKRKHAYKQAAPAVTTGVPAMVEVELTKDHIHAGKRYPAGTVLEVKKELADTIVSLGSGVLKEDDSQQVFEFNEPESTVSEDEPIN